MLLPLLFGLVYLALSARVLVKATVSLNDAQSAVSIALRVGGICLRFDGVLEHQGKTVMLRIRPRYGRNAQGGLRLSGSAASFRKAWPFVRAALRTLDWGQIELRMRVGLEDAAETAMAAGAARSAASALLACLGQAAPCDVRVEADFASPCFLLAARCIFFAVPGNIMIAVVKAAAKKTQREGFKWVSIPSRA